MTGRRRSGNTAIASVLHHRTMGHSVSGVVGGGASSPPVAGYFMWLAADAITGQGDNTALSNWPDGGSGNNAMTQATGANQPIYYKTTAGKTVNGKPAVWFTAANAHQMRTVSNAVSLPQPLSVYIVAGNATAAATYSALATNAWNCGIASTHYFMQAGSSITGGTTDNNVHNLSFYFNTTSTALVDGTATISGSAGTSGGTFSTWLGSAYFGGGNNWNGPICEVIVYTSILSGPNDTLVRGYLKTKWGTAG